MQLFSKNNLMKIILAIFAWIITILAWFFPTVLNNGHAVAQHSYILNSMLSFIVAIFLSYSLIKTATKNKK